MRASFGDCLQGTDVFLEREELLCSRLIPIGVCLAQRSRAKGARANRSPGPDSCGNGSGVRFSDGDLTSALSLSDIGKSRLRFRGGIEVSNHLMLRLVNSPDLSRPTKVSMTRP
jgi:hypothetical protein